MSSKSEVLRSQIMWAHSVGLTPDSGGYLPSIEDNLYQPLCNTTKEAFEKGNGSELQDTSTRPAKMKALHSSSALAVNFFDRWIGDDARALSDALLLDSGIQRIEFEKQYSTGLGGTPPNLDVVIELDSGLIVGIESKFTEWTSAKPTSDVSFKSKYFSRSPGLWRSRGLAKCQQLAEAIDAGRKVFRHLNAPQLLKHSLGMAAELDGRFSLQYIYFDWPCSESDIHKEEIDQFAHSVDTHLSFRAISYNDLYTTLADDARTDRAYLDYLGARYFAADEA